MDIIKEVTVYSNGCANEISTWSNVPYFFTQTLKAKGIKVNLVDLSTSRILNKLYRTFPLYKLLYKNTTHDYFRSLIHFLDTRYRIKKAIKEYPHSQINIFLTFSFSAIDLTTKPSVQFCDWTYDHSIRYFEKRPPDYLEKKSIAREDTQINGANLIFPLFPGVTEYMKVRYKNENIHYLGNVINSLYTIEEHEVISKKLASHNLLFIGGKKYIEGAQYLIQAYEILKKQNPALQLNIIGMISSDFTNLPIGVTCYGYLDKGIEKDRALYYSLLENAKVFINTTSKWGAFSASLEAMYFYTPVIVTPYTEFVNTFGSKIDFGYYCNDQDLTLLTNTITSLITAPSYNKLCINARTAVKDFTWDIYVDKMLKKIQENL